MARGGASGGGGSSGAGGRGGRDAGAAEAGGNGARDAGASDAGGRAAVLINEVVVDPQRDWSDSAGGNGVFFDVVPGNGSVTGSDEWIELYNAGLATVDLSGWTLVMTDGTPATEPLGAGDAVLAFSARGSISALAPGEYLVVGNPKGDLSNTVTLELFDANGALVDSVALGAEGAAPSGNASGVDDEAIARAPNGADTGNDAQDFTARSATPGAAN